MPFTEFYNRSGGSNLNAGGLATGLEPPTSAAYTSVGNWVNSTRVFTPTSGTNPFSTVNVGDMASIYVTSGATVATFIGRVTNVVNATNGAITIHASASMGANPADGSAGSMTIRVGGAWAGLNGTSNFPWGLSGIFNAVNTSGYQVRVNYKNDQTYTVTTTLEITNTQLVTLQGYTTTAGDGGKATWSSSDTSSYSWNFPGQGQTIIDLIFTSTAASGALPLVWCSNGSLWVRCVFKNGRGTGFFISASAGFVVAVECEFFTNNKSNGASYISGCHTAGGQLYAYNCYSHDNVGGSNSHGFSSTSGGGLHLINCISESNAGNGVNFDIVGTCPLVLIGCDIYNNSGDAIKTISSAAQAVGLLIRNCNFVKNTGKAINVSGSYTQQGGMLDKNGYGAGTQANAGGADVLKSVVDMGTAVTYPTDLVPWNAPATGDFRITLAAAKNTGRGAFTETDGTNTGTVAYPDIGASQHLDAGSSSLTVGGVGGG